MDRRDFLAATTGSSIFLAVKRRCDDIPDLATVSSIDSRDSTAYLAPAPARSTDGSCSGGPLSDAEQPFPTDPAWRKTVVPALNARFALPKPSAPLSDDLLELYAPFSRGFSWREPDDNQYRYTQAELLLNQAADLLDRGVRDRAEWNDSAVKQFNLNLEFLEFARLDEIHEHEIKAGIYTSVAKMSQSELDATDSAAGHNKAAVSQLQKQLEFYTDGAIDLAASVASNQAYGAVVPTFWKERDNISDNRGHMVFHLWNGTNASKEDIVMKTADFQTHQNMKSARSNITAQYENIAAAADADAARQLGLKARADWDTCDSGFKYERTQVARDMEIAKVKAAIEAGGVLNYGERMKPIRQRAELDLQESLAKVAAAAKGLRLLYGYTAPLPAPGAPGFFDDCVLWVRRAINWLVRFRQLEQSFALPISLRSHTSNWQEACRTGTFQLDLPESTFAYMRHVRLRGVSVLVIVDNGQGDPASLFQAVVTSPKTSSCKHLSGTVESLDQHFVPPCRIGRVAFRGNIREPDVVGATALYNVSPIGNWQLSMTTKSSTGIKLDSLRDIQLDMHLAFRASDKE